MALATAGSPCNWIESCPWIGHRMPASTLRENTIIFFTQAACSSSGPPLAAAMQDHSALSCACCWRFETPTHTPTTLQLTCNTPHTACGRGAACHVHLLLQDRLAGICVALKTDTHTQ